MPANPLAVLTSVKSLAQIERFMQSIRGKSADAEMVAHLRAIHEHVLSLLGDVNDDGDDGNDEDVDDPDQLEEQSDDEDKALLLELKVLAQQAMEIAGV